jgi:hypothetical protein
MRDRLQTLGFIFWRGGLLFLGAYGCYFAAAKALFWLNVFGFKIPLQLKIGAELLIGGALLVMLSLVVERYADAAQERDQLTEEQP